MFSTVNPVIPNFRPVWIDGSISQPSSTYFIRLDIPLVNPVVPMGFLPCSTLTQRYPVLAMLYTWLILQVRFSSVGNHLSLVEQVTFKREASMSHNALSKEPMPQTLRQSLWVSNCTFSPTPCSCDEVCTPDSSITDLGVITAKHQPIKMLQPNGLCNNISIKSVNQLRCNLKQRKHDYKVVDVQCLCQLKMWLYNKF
jgi:hypothetical protein